MKQEDIRKAIEEAKKNSPKRNFNQTYDLIIVYSNIDIKKPEQQVDFYANIPFSTGNDTRVCALIGPELMDNAKQSCDGAVGADEFEKYSKDKKLLKKLARDYDFFIAQANIMPKVAAAFGRVLGPRGKMPNPKAGCVVPPNANLKPLVTRLKKTVRVVAKTAPMSQVSVGKENSKEDDVIENILALYDQLIHHITGGKDSVRKIYLKLTMGKPVKIEL